MKNKFDKICYSEFIQYLEDNKIERMEETSVDADYWCEEYISVTPIESRLKTRYFSTDGGHQLK